MASTKQARQFQESELVVATHNAKKVEEISNLLQSYPIHFFSSKELGLSDVDETGITFEDNAILKAVSSAKESGKVCLADDSGFCVEAMNGAPGVYSGRFAELNGVRDFVFGMNKVWEETKDNPNKKASFVSVFALAWPDGHYEIVRGEVNGTLQWPPRGDNGFGYDAMFMPDGYTETFGEMRFEDKQKISHRALAFQMMIDRCFSQKKKTA